MVLRWACEHSAVPGLGASLGAALSFLYASRKGLALEELRQLLIDEVEPYASPKSKSASAVKAPYNPLSGESQIVPESMYTCVDGVWPTPLVPCAGVTLCLRRCFLNDFIHRCVGAPCSDDYMQRLWRVLESMGCVVVFGRLVIPPVLQTLRKVIHSTYLQDGAHLQLLYCHNSIRY